MLGNEIIEFVHPSVILVHKKVTYGRLVSDIRPNKEEKFHVRLTVGSNKLDFCGKAYSVAASLSTRKLLLSSVVSAPSAFFVTANIKDFSMLLPPRTRIHETSRKIIPQEIITQYNLLATQNNGWVYI